ncbi:Acyl-CoA N-acyltransferase [Penicillium verhagenii]|nr:Acyl-CoA N-acyltransferase [Penicillium verhagenii]
MVVEISPLTEADIHGAIRVIQHAFADDPYFKWVFDDSTWIPSTYRFNNDRNYHSLEARCRWGINNAIFQVAKEQQQQSPSDSPSPVLGVSCWLAPHPPAKPESWYSWYQGWVLSASQLLTNIRYFGRGGLRANRYWIWKEQQQKAQAEIWDDPRGYFFCNMVAVGPEAQGRGVGRLLFEAVTKRADEEGVKCYLESSKNVPNVQIYERMGFEMRRTMECRDGEDVCMLYCMMRNPKTE